MDYTSKEDFTASAKGIEVRGRTWDNDAFSNVHDKISTYLDAGDNIEAFRAALKNPAFPENGLRDANIENPAQALKSMRDHGLLQENGCISLGIQEVGKAMLSKAPSQNSVQPENNGFKETTLHKIARMPGT